ncbi:MAG: double-strand break repair protein AddB [Pseudomonadota bacterium]
MFLKDEPRLFGLPPGVDFARAVIDGIERRLSGEAPEAWARVTLIVNTRRMARRLTALFDDGPARLLPKILTFADLDTLAPDFLLPQSHSFLRRRLELRQLVEKLLDQLDNPTPRSSLFDLADSLASLIDEMQSEGIDADAINQIDVGSISGHWTNTKAFVDIANRYIEETQTAPDPEGRQRKLIEHLARRWKEKPSLNPVIVAGSTGSRAPTLMLMKAVSSLPNGAVILPGFDFHLSKAVWSELKDPLTACDHSQFRFQKVGDALGVDPTVIRTWLDRKPVSPERNRLVSLSLRPAPVTDAWRREGPELTDHDAATADITLLCADRPRTEALAIAMRLRQAAEEGQSAALITPDRNLTRQVAAALDRWGVIPDDSAGLPLHLSPPGRFLRQIAGLFAHRLDAQALLSLLKHPLTHSGSDRNVHQLHTQRLELRMRRDGLPYPTAGKIIEAAEKITHKDVENMVDWANWVTASICGRHCDQQLPLEDWVNLHLATANELASGHRAEQSGLWSRNDGEKAAAVMTALADDAKHGARLSGVEYYDLINALLSREVVRDAETPYPGIMIWGTLEARVQGADLVILGGLNEGTWPEAPNPDPWLNRHMRQQAGLPLPEARIGLAAHDYQQAVAAPEVWLTRSIRSDEAETVPSRWINRLQNLMSGLEDQGGRAAWEAMAGRGDVWLAKVRQLEQSNPIERATRPAPCPPVATRPRKLAVTEIKTLIRNPYAIYARHSLRLRALNPLVPSPSALERGTVNHLFLERFLRSILKDAGNLERDHFLHLAHETLDETVPWPTARAVWLARLDRIADWFVEGEKDRQQQARPVAMENEAKGALTLPKSSIEIECRADRIDLDEAGQAIIYDYKSGSPPTGPEQRHFDKQLLVEAAILENGGIVDLGVRPVRDAVFIGLGGQGKLSAAPLADEPPAEVIAKLDALLCRYLEPDQGFAARRAMRSDQDESDFDQLSRYGEWSASDPIELVRVE